MKNPFGTSFKAEAQSYGDRTMLPAGLYIGAIIGVKPEEDRLTMQVEITEGDFAGYYKKDYDAQNSQYRPKKYKGVYVLRFPDGNNSRSDQFREREAKGCAWAVEQSNEGYHWNWETVERELKGKAVGLNVRERDWAMEDTINGGWRTGTTTEIARFESIQDIRNGKAKVARKRELSQNDKDRMAQSDAAEPAGFTAVETEELPF